MPSNRDDWWVGTWQLPARTIGGKRRYPVNLANAEELRCGETLSGTPTATCVPSGTGCPVISDVAYNAAPVSIVSNGTVATAPAGTLLLFTVDVSGVAPGDYSLYFLAYTSGGAELVPWGTLVVP